MNRRINLSKRDALAQSKASLDFLASAAGVEPEPFLTTMKPKVSRPRRPSGVPLEREVLHHVMRRLRQHPMVAFAWRTQVGVYELSDGRIITVGVVGEPDIIGALVGGRVFGCECKRIGENPSADQAHRLKQINECGGLGFVARCAEDVNRALEGTK